LRRRDGHANRAWRDLRHSSITTRARSPGLSKARANSSARGLGHAYDDEVLALQLELCLPRLLVVSRTRGCVRRLAGFRPESWFAGPARTILRLLGAQERRG
jgi:hypothetical protein